MSQTPDIEYRGHFIAVQAYQSDGQRWRPKALVSIYQGGTVHQTSVSAPVEVSFDSEDDAVTYSLLMAKKWIDDH
ncbi:MAG TPA: hypothetical protein VGA90_13280 [Methylomirabilota bacterium]|jgi:hypothetical protein